MPYISASSKLLSLCVTNDQTVERMERKRKNKVRFELKIPYRRSADHVSSTYCKLGSKLAVTKTEVLKKLRALCERLDTEERRERTEKIMNYFVNTFP